MLTSHNVLLTGEAGSIGPTPTIASRGEYRCMTKLIRTVCAGTLSDHYSYLFNTEYYC